MVAKHKGPPTQKAFFSLIVGKNAQCFMTMLYYTFCMKGYHLHPYQPQLDEPLRPDEKNSTGKEKRRKKRGHLCMTG